MVWVPAEALLLPVALEDVEDLEPQAAGRQQAQPDGAPGPGAGELEQVSAGW